MCSNWTTFAVIPNETCARYWNSVAIATNSGVSATISGFRAKLSFTNASDSLLAARPHALHSLDPQGGVDIADIKRRCGTRVCLIGNVNCGLLDTGTDKQVIASARYALRSGMPGGGYIFSTSNCIYTGMPLARYELMLQVWRAEGNY